jgi:23S rRNA pseudouridine2605 synthase
MMERIQKIISGRGVVSRRQAEKMIEDGRVTCNGSAGIVGQSADPDTDVIAIDGIPLPSVAQKVYIMLHKPRGYVTTLSDEKGRKDVSQLVADCQTRVYPVGRLDMDSEGLLLLTNDGELTNKLTHPKHEIPKIYHVRAAGTVTPEQINKLSSAMDIDGYEIAPVKTELISIKDGSSTLRMTLFEGRNRQIRKMCEQTDIKILRLCRVAIGDITLGNLAPGKWKYLTKSQVEYLKNVKPPKVSARDNK